MQRVCQEAQLLGQLCWPICDPYSRIVTIGSAPSLQEPHAQQLTNYYITLPLQSTYKP